MAPLPIVMYNPSMGNESVDDPTIRACIALAKYNQFGSIVIANLHAYITPDPKALRRAEDPFGADNAIHLQSLIALAVNEVSPILCAWGANPVLDNADITFVRRAQSHKARTVCIGQTAVGAPRHPLFVPRWSKFKEFSL